MLQAEQKYSFCGNLVLEQDEHKSSLSILTQFIAQRGAVGSRLGMVHKST
jgi:hypothetical protein